MTREELQRLYDECRLRGFRAEQLAGLVRGVESFLAEPDPTVEIAYLKAKLADVEAERDQAAVKALTARAEAAEQAVQRVRDMPATPPSGGYYMVSMRDVLRALDGGAS